MNPLRLVGVGCGGRTRTYLTLAAREPERFQIVGAADPLPERVERLRHLATGEFHAFASDAELWAAGKIADIAVIGTQDAYHLEPCLAALRAGYDVLLEKPVADDPAKVLAIEIEARRLGRRVLVCHVLRYAPFYRKVREIVDSGRLGELVTIEAREGVDAWHQAHSFVRGHWSVVEKATPMIVAKCCHDLDILCWLADAPCTHVSSFGENTFFNAAHQPEGATARCTDPCPLAHRCEYSALHYLDRHKNWLRHVFDRADEATDAEKRAWLAESPWGRCVWQCDNTTVDHQTVGLRFGSGLTASLTMTAFDAGRTLQIFGTRARLRGGDSIHRHSGAHILVEDQHGHALERFNVDTQGGHGGADPALVRALYDEMTAATPADMRTSIQQSIESHLAGFAAEQARREATTIHLPTWRARLNAEAWL